MAPTAHETPVRVPRLALALALALAPGAAAPQGSLQRAAEEIAARLAERGDPGGTVALLVVAPGHEALSAPLESALAEALSARGRTVAPLRGPSLAEPEEGARALGADVLLRVSAGLVPGRRALAVAAELVPVRPNFFLQRAPGVRPAGSRLATATVPADATALALARVGRARPALAVRPLAELGERVLALAAGDARGDGATLLAAATPSGLWILDPGGRVLGRRPAGPAPLPVRRPAAAVAVGDFGGGRVAWQRAGDPRGEVLAWDGSTLAPVAPLEAAPLCAGAAGRLFGRFLPGKATLADLLSPAVDPSSRPRSGRELWGVAAAPGPGRLAFAVAADDGTLELLGPDLAPVAPPLSGVGAGFALADLDGDGAPEVVASAAELAATDRLRVLRLSAGGEPLVLHESGPIPGALVAGAGGDVTGDGLDDAVLAAALPGGESRLWLVTADARFGEGQ